MRNMRKTLALILAMIIFQTLKAPGRRIAQIVSSMPRPEMSR